MASIKKDLRGYICDDREKNWSKEYAAREILKHKKNKILDHPDSCITTSKLADRCVTEEKIDESIILSINENKTGLEELHSSLLSEISARKFGDDKKADKDDVYSKEEVDNSQKYLREELNMVSSRLDNEVVVRNKELEKKADKTVLDLIYTSLNSKAERVELDTKADKVKYVTFKDTDVIKVLDNTEYIASGEISTLTIEYPETDFICSLEFSTKEEGDITIILPQSKYIGEVPTFKNGEIWELSIKNGIVIGGLAI